MNIAVASRKPGRTGFAQEICSFAKKPFKMAKIEIYSHLILHIEQAEKPLLISNHEFHF